ncbi:MAG: hypothetical protein JWR84_2867, partial [Caulobacter sp.]|nr:hypothetical protein [Caulobacter sp.]
GYMDINGNTGPRVDFGFAIQQRLATVVAVIDPNTALAFLASSGTNPALAATARVWFDGQPSAGQTITLNGSAITFVASGAAGMQVNIGASPQATAFAAAGLINANSGTFGMTAFCPVGNSVIELIATTTGTAGNSYGLTKTASNVRFTAGGATANVSLMSGGAAGETVAAGLYHASTNFQGRNSALGAGGLATYANPGGANYYYLSSVLRERDFPEIRLYGGGALLGRAFGTTAGRTRDTTASLWAALTGGGTGNAKIACAQLFDGRALSDADDLANYLALKTAIQAIGPTVN